MPPLRRLVRSIFAVTLAFLLPSVRAQVVINELCAKPSGQALQFAADGSPIVGYLPKWNGTAYSDSSWSSGLLPAGYGSTVNTNLQSAMQNNTPSLYLRKSFTVTSAQAASTLPLVLQVDYDDGFVAYLNGVEVARYNCGGAKHYMYASQTAYNTNTASGVTEVTLGAANTLLVTGTNVLSMEVRNFDFASNFRANAGLKLITSTAPIALVKALYDNNAATGATRTHTNTNGSITNTSSGTPIAGGWLANAANPVSDNLWTSLQIVTGELAGAGVGGSGGIRYTITQSGTNRTASVSAPTVSMANAWVPGGLANSSLSATTIKCRYRTTGDLQFGFRCDPGPGQGANSIDGFPALGLPFGPAADYDWTSANGGTYGQTIDAAGNKTSTIGGSINIGNYEHYIGSGVRSGQVTIKEDNTAGAGPGGTTGILSYIWTTFPAVIDSLGFGIKNLQVPEWPASPTSLTATDFQRTRLTFRWKLPAGRAQTFYLEGNAGGTATDRATIGTLIGTGSWETFSGSLSDLSNSAGLLSKLNHTSPRYTKLTSYYAGVPFANGEAVQIDAVNIYYEAAGSQVVENTANTFSGATGATRTRTIDGSGVVSDATAGTLVNNVTLNSDPAITGFTFRVVEDNTAAAGNNGSTGFLRCEVTQPPTVGGPWGFSLPGVTVRNWTTGAITTAQLADVSMQFAAKIPAGVTLTLYAEPLGGSTANRASLGTLTGNGSWQTVLREFAGAANVDNFRIALNAGNTKSFQLTFVGPSVPTIGDQIAIDDVQINLWRTYQVQMSQGTNQQRFLDTLNSANSISFIPTFVKNTAPSVSGATFSVDDFEVDYNGQDPNAFQALIGLGASGGTWKYFVGVAEPSGGLFDPALITAFVQPPVGEESDYSNPEEFRDWLELKNIGGSAVTLTNWTMTDDTKYPAKWTFPAGTQIPAGGYLIVMCDNRNEANGTATYIHSSFSLSGSNPTVYLYNPSGVLQDQVNGGPAQDSFHTYARIPDGIGAFGFTDTGTPGAANAGIATSSRVKQPDFFKADGVTTFSGGFYTGTQTLVITSATAGAQIRYTTDGTDPTETTGIVYSGPITLTAPADQKSASVIIGRAYKSGMLASDPRVRNYLIDVNANIKTLPSLLYTGDPGRNFYAPNGIMTIVGGTYPGGLWLANGPQTYNIPQGHGEPFERGISAEWCYPSGIDGWREDIGIRISSSPYSRPRLVLTTMGNSPWNADPTQKPSFDLYWRSDYGNSSVKDDNMIPGNDVSDYSRLRIRAGKNDISNPYIIDEVGRRLYRDMGWVQPTGTFNTLYVNGSFKGLFNLTERLRSQTFQIHYRTTDDFDVNYIDTFVDGDPTFWNQMQAALNALNSSTTLANYQAAQQYIDPVNVADAFLFWIYVNMDDWPGNNWAAQRERGPGGVYRMATWDMEAAFGRFGKPVTYDTINNNLLNFSSTCGDIFKRLYKSPEFKLLVADRIEKHFFNGGVLDDRGAGGGHFGALVNGYAAQVQPLLTYLGYGAIDLSWYNTQIASRRNFLFGGGTGSFQQTLLWPATQPPVFSQFGGVVPSGYQLTITMSAPAGAVLYYTLDGTDPRLPGGGISASAHVYNGPITLNLLTTVNARIRLSDGTWSALNSAYFEPAAAQPTAGTLVVSELMYHPANPTYSERITGFTSSDDFEFIRLTNIGAAPVDLHNLRFTQGITYDFTGTAVGAINPGASVLVVRNKDAFQYRYGQTYNATIAGEYAGTFSNSGETVTLAIVNGANTTTLETFTYSDTAPWPVAADGFGPSLILINPNTAPNPNLPTNWTASAQPNGMPGGVTRPLTYSGWKQYVFNELDTANGAVSGPLADSDGDGLNNFLEYTLGAVPGFPDRMARQPVVTIENVGGQNYVTLTYTLNAGATDATVLPEVSGDLVTWANGAGNVITVSGPTNNINGSVTWKVRDATPTTSATTRYIHLKATGP